LANIYRSLRNTNVPNSFRHIPNITELSDEILKDRGYYRGFQCPHGHTIRHSEEHYCYLCVKKIISNICGFDINYLHVDYKGKYQSLWNRIQISEPDECWEIQNNSIYTPKRFCFPSYRSLYSKQKAENVTFHKAIYQCAWGDIGTGVVTRLCSNPLCGNPLHLVSSWNRMYPPRTIHPFCTEFEAKKLMYFASINNDVEKIKDLYKSTISSPLKNKESEE